MLVLRRKSFDKLLFDFSWKCYDINKYWYTRKHFYTFMYSVYWIKTFFLYKHKISFILALSQVYITRQKIRLNHEKWQHKINKINWNRLTCLCWYTKQRSWIFGSLGVKKLHETWVMTISMSTMFMFWYGLWTLNIYTHDNARTPYTLIWIIKINNLTNIHIWENS